MLEQVSALAVSDSVSTDSLTTQEGMELKANGVPRPKIFEHINTGVYVVGMDGRWLKVNRALCTMLGRSQEELNATTCQALTHPEDLPANIEGLKGLIAGEADEYHSEKRYFHKNGKPVRVLLSVELVRDSNDKPLCFVGQIRELTDYSRNGH